MSTDTHSEAQNDFSSRPDPVGGDFQGSFAGRWLKRGLVAIVLLAVLVSAVALIPGMLSSQESGAHHMTYSVKRGDLVVTVTEQGFLESSDNTEILCKVRGRNTVTKVIKNGELVKAGDVLVTLDTKVIEENLSLQRTNVHIATATLAETKAEVAGDEIAIDAYLEGKYRSRLKTRETNLAIAESNLRSARKRYEYSKLLFKQGYVTKLELEGNAFTVTQAELELKVNQTEIDVLKRFTKAMELETMHGRLKARRIKLQADLAGLAMDTARRERAKKELANCVIRAPRSGLVIYPTAESWKNVPDIAEGVAISRDQVLLIMPRLNQMQVKVGIHEAIVDRVKPDLVANITLPGGKLKARVTSVARIAKPLGEWDGNVVTYETIIMLPPVKKSASGKKPSQGLELAPGMSAEVEIVIAEYKDVTIVPLATVVEIDGRFFCWIETENGPRKRLLVLGENNDVNVIVKDGVKPGDEVVLNPLAYVDEAQKDANQIAE